MSRFTTVFWDVDNTLLDFAYSQRCALGNCFLTIHRVLTEDMLKRYSQINDSYWKRLELGEITKEELLNGRFTTFFREYGITDVDVNAFRTQYQEELGCHFAYLDDSLTICKELQGKVKQYVVTNGVVYTQRKKLELSGFLQIMDGVFISEEIGAPKPHQEFFSHCLERIEEKDKDKIILIGDSLTSDIKGGAMAGIVTCWYRPKGSTNNSQYRPDYEISNLHEIFQILEEKETKR